MSTTQPEPHPAEQERSGESQVRYVEELAGPDDAWISLTDAARMTRTSEAMARRWVTSGRLAVRRQPVGMNQRTRLVRLSDVAAIRPIIDPAAAITDEIRKLDLPSIPRQQAQIMRDHEQLLQQVQHGQEAISEVRRNLEDVSAQFHRAVEELHHGLLSHLASLQELRSRQQQQHDMLAAQKDQMHTLEQMTQEMTARSEQFLHDLELLRTVVMAQRQEIQQAVEQKIAALDQEHRRQADQLRQNLTSRLQQQQERIDDALQAMKGTLGRQEQAQVQLQQDLAAQQETLMTLIEQRVRAVQTSFEQSLLQQAQDWAALDQRLEKFEQKLDQGSRRAEAERVMLLDYQKRFEAQDQRLQTLSTQLQDEVEERKRLSEQLMTQQEQLRMLIFPNQH